MGIKIWWQDLFPEAHQIAKDLGAGDPEIQEQVDGKILEVSRLVARPDTNIEIHHTRHSAYKVHPTYLEMINNVSVIDGIIEAEKSGYDAAIIGCGNDSALQQARQAVDIPVIGPTEASLSLSSMLGHKVAVITIADELIPVLERNIRIYGLEWRVARPIRVYRFVETGGMGLIKLILNPTALNPQFENLCRLCIDDGAEVIVPACSGLSAATSLSGCKEIQGAPVIDINQAAVKTAEMLVDLKRSIGLGKSQRHWYRSLPREERDRLVKFGLSR